MKTMLLISENWDLFASRDLLSIVNAVQRSQRRQA